MNAECACLIRALMSPKDMRAFTLTQWDRLVPQARAAGLLGRLGAIADRNGLLAGLPTPVRHALEAGLTLASRQATAVRYELNQLDKALADLGTPVLLLKGAAYVASNSGAAPGRLMSDIDLLVSKPNIPHAEAALMLAGWVSSHRNAYDQRYYREWMHEIPPMEHSRRGTVLDLHHNLLPKTARIQTFPAKLIDSARPLAGARCLRVPSELDLILHSATHLMHEGEWDHGFRDLADLAALVTEAAARDPAFSTRLLARAKDLNLEGPLYYAHEQLRLIFGAEPLRSDLSQPGRLVHSLTNALLARGLGSFHSDCHKSFTRTAVFLLYVRSHWLRMPLRLLVPHLLHKAFRQQGNAENDG